MKKVIALFLIISLISGCDKQLQNGSKSATAINTVAKDVNPQNVNAGSVDKDANLKDGGKFDEEIVQIKREEQDDRRAAEAEAEARLKKKSNPTPAPPPMPILTPKPTSTPKPIPTPTPKPTLTPTPKSPPPPKPSPSFVSSVWPFVKTWYVQIVAVAILAFVAINGLYCSDPAAPIYDVSDDGKPAKDTAPSGKKHRKHRTKSAVSVPPSGGSDVPAHV
ncbi:MAG: hypothetical protein LE169_03345 [Endomicrobium sp.]|nr:hypothetical protein [Endomicrobium sp.]